MAKKKCCPCPLDIARAKVRAAKTCEEFNQAAEAFMLAYREERDSLPEGASKNRYSRLLASEFGRIVKKTAVRCAYPNKSPKAVNAITKAEISLARARRAANREIDKALKAREAATQLEGMRRRRYA